MFWVLRRYQLCLKVSLSLVLLCTTCIVYPYLKHNYEEFERVTYPVATWDWKSDEVRLEAIPDIMNGEERARLVWERCNKASTPAPCPYTNRPLKKRLFPVPDKKFVLCTVGKTGSSNWKTLILLLTQRISEAEAKTMLFPHSMKLWLDGGIVSKIRKKSVLSDVMSNYYRVTFVRDPLSRILSAYKDKFTGNSTAYHFRIYRNYRSKIICHVLSLMEEVRPDGDLVPEEIYSYLKSEISEHCHPPRDFNVSLGMFWTFLIFISERFFEEHPDTPCAVTLLDFKETRINTHFMNMISLCGHCNARYKYDFIGTVETMTEDTAFLRQKYDIKYQLPQLDSTQSGVLQNSEVRALHDKLPYLLRQYAIMYMRYDATIFGYEGYDNPDIRQGQYPNHTEMQQCDDL